MSQYDVVPGEWWFSLILPFPEPLLLWGLTLGCCVVGDSGSLLIAAPQLDVDVYAFIRKEPMKEQDLGSPGCPFKALQRCVRTVTARPQMYTTWWYFKKFDYAAVSELARCSGTESTRLYHGLQNGLCLCVTLQQGFLFHADISLFWLASARQQPPVHRPSCIHVVIISKGNLDRTVSYLQSVPPALRIKKSQDTRTD